MKAPKERNKREGLNQGYRFRCASPIDGWYLQVLPTGAAACIAFQAHPSKCKKRLCRKCCRSLWWDRNGPHTTPQAAIIIGVSFCSTQKPYLDQNTLKICEALMNCRQKIKAPDQSESEGWEVAVRLLTSYCYCIRQPNIYPCDLTIRADFTHIQAPSNLQFKIEAQQAPSKKSCRLKSFTGTRSRMARGEDACHN